MSDVEQSGDGPVDGPDHGPADRAGEARAPQATRRALMLGAVGAAAVVSIRPALAQTAGSVMHCEIPVPDAGHAGQYIKPDGTLAPAGTQGAFAPPAMPLKGEDVKRALAGGGSLPGVDYERSQAYLQYVQKLQRGTAGFTCFASLQMLRK